MVDMSKILISVPHKHGIAIGDGAVIEKEYELCITTGSFEMREIMTQHEYVVLYGLLGRMIRNNTWPKEDFNA